MDTWLYQINVTRDCNLRCTHCYIHSDAKAASKKMTSEQIVGIADGIKTHMGTNGRTHAEIHVIGGEPTMLGLPFFEEIMPQIRQCFEGVAFTYELIIVSNLLTDDAMKIVPLFDRVCSSYEPKSRFISSKGREIILLQDRWEMNMQKLLAMGLDVGVTTAITKPTVAMGAERLLNYFTRLGLKQVHLGFFIPGGDGEVNKNDIAPSFIETSNFLIDAANWYLERRASDDALMINPVESMLNAIHNNEPMGDIVCPIIQGSMDINWDGNAISCIEKGGEVSPKWSGNVFDSSITAVARSPIFIKEIRDASKPQKACLDCSDYEICRSGCGVLHAHWDPADEDCPGFKKFITYMRGIHAQGILPRAAGMGRIC